jgi:hypothetical protein
MAKGIGSKGQSASPTARPRKAKDTSIVSVPGKKAAPTKSNTLVRGKNGGTGHR